MVRRDGQLVWVLDDALVAEVDSYGVVQHGLLYEITERKRTELLLAEHAVLLERVAQGETVTPGLIELASATEAISGAARCVIAVTAAGPDGPEVLLSSAGELAAVELLPLGPARYQAAITAPDGTALGNVGLHYPAPAVVQERDVDWPAGPPDWPPWRWSGPPNMPAPARPCRCWRPPWSRPRTASWWSAPPGRCSATTRR